jgi:hypothetical protein
MTVMTHASPSEIAVFLLALIGAGFSFFNLLSSIGVLSDMSRQRRNGTLRTMARVMAIHESSRLIGQILLVVMASLFFTLPSTTQLTSVGKFGQFAIIALSAVLLFQSAVSAYSRARVLEPTVYYWLHQKRRLSVTRERIIWTIVWVVMGAGNVAMIRITAGLASGMIPVSPGLAPFLPTIIDVLAFLIGVTGSFLPSIKQLSEKGNHIGDS